jgi:hypothetical protein
MRFLLLSCGSILIHVIFVGTESDATSVLLSCGGSTDSTYASLHLVLEVRVWDTSLLWEHLMTEALFCNSSPSSAANPSDAPGPSSHLIVIILDSFLDN